MSGSKVLGMVAVTALAVAFASSQAAAVKCTGYTIDVPKAGAKKKADCNGFCLDAVTVCKAAATAPAVCADTTLFPTTKLQRKCKKLAKKAKKACKPCLTKVCVADGDAPEACSPSGAFVDTGTGPLF